MRGEAAPVHVAKSDLREGPVSPRSLSPRSEAVVSPRHALRPTKAQNRSPSATVPAPTTSPSAPKPSAPTAKPLAVPAEAAASKEPPAMPPLPLYNETLRGDVGEEFSSN